jgi:acyl carrier protein
MRHEEVVFEELHKILTGLIGEDEVKILGIERESEFTADLMMDSIQIIAFAERVNELYGDRVNFNRWLSRKPLKALMRLSVGDVSEYISKELK